MFGKAKSDENTETDANESAEKDEDTEEREINPNSKFEKVINSNSTDYFEVYEYKKLKEVNTNIKIGSKLIKL